MHLEIVLQASFAKAVASQVKKSDTFTAKDRNCTDHGSFKQVGYLSVRSKVAFQTTSKNVVHLSRPSE